jgi:flagellar biosynthetic protein FliO
VTSEGVNLALSLLGMLLLLLLIFAGAYFTTRFIGGRYQGRMGAGKNAEILERVPLGRDGSLLIVRAGGKVLLLGVTSHHIDRLAELDEAPFAALSGPQPRQSEFYALWRALSGRRRDDDGGEGG